MADKVYAVIDTNIIVSALISKITESYPLSVMAHVYSGAIIPVFNNEIMDHLPLSDIPMLVSSINFLLRDEEFDDLDQICYCFGVEREEMDLEAGKISLKSPIGAALMGKKVGEIAEAKTPTGVLKLLVESITQA